MTTGIIYVLINAAMPGYVKVGSTDDLERRIKEMYSTNVPLPFECFYACEVDNYKKVERYIHDAFLDHRTTNAREFFEISPERVVSALKPLEIKDVTPKTDIVDSKEDLLALNKARNRRAVFNFKMVGIPVGAELYFSRNEEIKATVKDNRTIIYNGEETSLSASAKKILKASNAVAGTDYWSYEGETLVERRHRMEEEI